jgi:hypothetical protein
MQARKIKGECDLAGGRPSAWVLNVTGCLNLCMAIVSEGRLSQTDLLPDCDDYVRTLKIAIRNGSVGQGPRWLVCATVGYVCTVQTAPVPAVSASTSSGSYCC